MKKKSEFEAPYIGIETIDNTPIFYNRRGDYSVIIKCENPIIQYSADMDAYYDFHHLFTNILKVLGNFYSPLFINTLDRSVFSFGIISPFECCKDSVLYCISAYC